MEDVRTIIGTNSVIPVATLEDAERAVDVADALVRGGISVIEITFRTDAAVQSIQRCRDLGDRIRVGAGTVRTRAQVDQAIDAGAEFIVSPGFNPDICEYVLSRGIPHIPGTITPGEVEQANALGLDVLKFFPAEAAGGVDFLKSLAAVYPDVSFVPTGGIKKENLSDYLALPNVVACGGSWLTNRRWVEAGEYERIVEACIDARNGV